MKSRFKNLGGILVLLIITLVISSSAVVIGDYIVAPPDHETTAGNSNNGIPIGWWTVMYGGASRYQQLYNPSELSGKSGVITNVYWRTDEQFGTTTTQATLYNVEIYLGNSLASSLSTVYSWNAGQCPDWTLVYSAPITYVTADTGGLKWCQLGDIWDIFSYDGTSGLLLELRFTYMTGGITIDADRDPGIHRLFWYNYNAYSGSSSSGYGAVTKFDLESGIPADVRMEPQSLNLDSNGNYVNFKIYGFPENPEYSPLDVDPTSVTVAGVGANLKYGTFNDNKYIGKADRLLVEDAIGNPGDDVEVTIDGKLNDGTSFKGIAIIKAV